jgi:hypothetical protein
MMAMRKRRRRRRLGMRLMVRTRMIGLRRTTIIHSKWDSAVAKIENTAGSIAVGSLL